jgi:glycerol-3-phosphate cytidylyltransferase-like family protein
MLVRVYSGGNFDLPSISHFNFFKAIKQAVSNMSDEHESYIICGLNTDEFAIRYKKRKPIYTLEERMHYMKYCPYIDKVIVNEGDENSWIAIQKNLPIDYIAHGSDWMGDSLIKQLGVTKELLDEHKIKMLYVPYIGEYSTTSVIKTIIERYKPDGK